MCAGTSAAIGEGLRGVPGRPEAPGAGVASPPPRPEKAEEGHAARRPHTHRSCGGLRSGSRDRALARETPRLSALSRNCMNREPVPAVPALCPQRCSHAVRADDCLAVHTNP